MATHFKLLNEDAVIKNLNKEIQKIKGRTKVGMEVAARLVMHRSREKTPVDTGNLKGGHYVATGTVNGGPVAEVGVTADYAVPVHEILENKHPVGQAKFLEAAVHESQTAILDIVRRRARIK